MDIRTRETANFIINFMSTKPKTEFDEAKRILYTGINTALRCMEGLITSIEYRENRWRAEYHELDKEVKHLKAERLMHNIGDAPDSSQVISELREKMTVMIGEISKLKDDLSDALTDSVHSEKLYQEAIKERDSAKRDLAVALDDHFRKDKVLNDLHHILEVTKKERDDAIDCRNITRVVYEDLSNELGGIKKERDDALKERDTLKVQMIESQGRADQLRRQLAKASDERDAARIAVDLGLKDRTRMVKENKELLNAFDDFKAKAIEVHKERDNYRDRCQHYVTAFENARKALNT